jgi:hypothetical protein
MAVWRKIFLKFWDSAEVVKLKPADKLLALYLLTSPQTNRIGLYVLSIARTAEALGLSRDSARKGIERVCEGLAWAFDPLHSGTLKNYHKPRCYKHL